MRNGLLILAGLAILGGCSFEMPGFLGREGTGAGLYSPRPDPLPDPVAVPLRSAVLERALHGVIVRVEGVAPRQGYHTAELVPVGVSDAGVIGLQLVAVPPQGPGAVGPERTRLLTAAFFMSNRALEDVRGFQVAGTGGGQATLSLR